MELSPIWPLPVLNDKGIRSCMEKGIIQVSEITDDQIQPATLDMRIGRVKVYDPEAIDRTVAHYNRHGPVRNGLPTDQFAAVYEDVKDMPLTISSAAYMEVYLHEQIKVKDLVLNADLRSSRGRPGFRLDHEFPERDDDGLYFLGVKNRNPNPLIIHGQSKFPQLFFVPTTENKEPMQGVPLNDPATIAGLFPEFAERGLITPQGYLIFLLGDYILRFKENLGPIDLSKRYDDEYLYDRIDTKQGGVIMPGDCSIAQLVPELDLPDTLGIRLVSSTPYLQIPGWCGPNPALQHIDADVANGRWVDPGYKGKITAHPYRRKFPLPLQQGMPFALGVVYHYPDGCGRAYGSTGLSSHYQGSQGIGSRS